MKTKMLIMIMLMLIGSQGHASSVLVGNGISWTTSISGVGSQTGTVTLNADVSGASFGWGDVGYLSGIGIKNIGDPESSNFNITSVSLTNWGANNAEISSSGTACSGGGSKPHRACTFAPTLADRISSAAGDLAIVLGIELESGVLSNAYDFKVRWENLEGTHTGSHISDELTAVPIPAAAWLFASALVGLVTIARRGKGKLPLLAA
ncbi:MAG TPA: VPLPA-CTERM sorting domain-containing protein [Halioglobus sp.]